MDHHALTIPSDQAVSLKPEAIYTAIEHDGRAEIMLKDLAEKVCGIAGWDVTPVMVDGKPYEVPAEVLDHLHYKQPVFDGVEGVALLADYVGTEDGTGIVHNSPGHGVDDYYVCMKEGMDVCMPVDDDGRFYNGDEFGAGGPFSGMDTDEANPHIIQFLRDRGMLVAEVKITHSYPHCWRCKNPVLFRATDQWFVSMDKTGLREQALDQVRNHVSWYPRARRQPHRRHGGAASRLVHLPSAQLGRADSVLHLRRLWREDHERRHARRGHRSVP